MPRGDQLPPSMATAKMLILANERTGKSEWAMRAAKAGFNVLFIDGDGAQRTLSEQDADTKHRIFYFSVMDRMEEGVYAPRMIEFVAAFFSEGKILWNDTRQEVYNRAKDDLAESAIWEIYPSRFDHTWVVVIDSWTALAMSALAAKANDLNVQLADIEKVDRKIYSGVGNRLTQIAQVVKGAPFHVIVTGHPAEYAKKRAPEGKVLRDIKEEDMITEWTRMIPKSSSNPHGLTLGKNFTDIGWIDVSLGGNRILDFRIAQGRTSGGTITGKGDPRKEYAFAELIRQSNGFVPDGKQDMGRGLIMFEKGEWQPPAPKTLASVTKPASTIQMPTPNKGLGALLNKGGANTPKPATT
jgi:hypothetical protein